MTRWEFWPPWRFYPPVVLYVAWLGVRFRGPLLFTAANPAIEGGGFISESKWRILQGLSGSGERVARTCLVPAGDLEQRAARVGEFRAREGLGFPIVLKPDAGQRGSGVAVIRNAAEIDEYLGRVDVDVLAQEYVPGHELGVFYYRYPDRERGHILSVTDKRIPVVRGDGRRTLEELILADSRAVCMADHYLRVQRRPLDDVPAPGEEVPLVELGTHCRGAIFLDGSSLATERLEQAIDAVSRGFEGFYFGRYDLRTPDLEKLRRGEGFKIIELNGVTSEATHIYDPATRLMQAWRTLFRQWRIAFEIGRINRDRGVRPTGLTELLRMMIAYRRSSSTHAR